MSTATTIKKSSDSDAIFLMLQFNELTGKWAIDSATAKLVGDIPEQDRPEDLQKLVEDQFPGRSVMFHKPFDMSPE